MELFFSKAFDAPPLPPTQKGSAFETKIKNYPFYQARCYSHSPACLRFSPYKKWRSFNRYAIFIFLYFVFPNYGLCLSIL